MQWFVVKNDLKNGNPMNQVQILLESLVLMRLHNQVLSFENIIHLELSLCNYCHLHYVASDKLSHVNKKEAIKNDGEAFFICR